MHRLGLTPLGVWLPRVAEMVDLNNGLVSYWKLDEASGSRADSKGTSTLLDNNTVGTTTGKRGNAALHVATATEYLNATDNADVSVDGMQSFTLSLWVQFTTLAATNQMLVTKSNNLNSGTAQEFALYYVNNGRLRLRVANGTTTVDVTDTTTLSTATWYHIVAWRDVAAGVIGISVNTAATTAAFAGTLSIPATTISFRVGVLGTVTSPLDGATDELALWKRALNSAERAALYNGGAGVTYPF